MQRFLSSWLPMLAQHRRLLLVAAFAALGGGWYLTVPSAPLATWQANTRVEHVTLVSPHTLLVSADQKATLLMLPSMTVVQEMSYDGVLAGMAGTQGQYLIATSVDGHWLAVALLSSRETAPGERDSFVDIWSMTEQRRLARIPVPLTQTKAYFYALTMSRDGQRIGWITQGRGTYRSTVTVWDRHTQTITFTRTIEDATRGFGLTVYLLGLEPFEFIGIYYGNKHIEVHQLQDDNVLYRGTLPAFPTVISADNVLIAAVDGNNTMSVWSLHDGHLVWRFPMRRTTSFLSADTWHGRVVFSDDSRYIVTAAFVEPFMGGLEIGAPRFGKPLTSEPAALWDVHTGQVVQRFDVQPNGAMLLAYSPDGQYVAAARGNEVRVFRVAPQPPYLQPALLLVGLLLLVLSALGWMWARRGQS